MRARAAIPLVVLALAGASLAAAGPAAGATSCADWNLPPSPETMKRVAVAVVCLINEQRSAAGLAAVRGDARLDASSGFQARDMLSHHYLAHSRSGGPPLVSRIKATGYFDHVTGGLYTENVGLAPQGNATAWAVVDAWMRSDEHRVNILRPEFRDMGVGIAFSPPDPAFYPDWSSVIYATDYGRRYYSVPVPTCISTRSTDPGTPRTICTNRAHRRHRKHRRTRR